MLISSPANLPNPANHDGAHFRIPTLIAVVDDFLPFIGGPLGVLYIKTVSDRFVSSQFLAPAGSEYSISQVTFVVKECI